MQGKVCLITGGNAGIGFYTALALAQQGAEVVISGRNSSKLEKAQKAIVAGTGNQKVHTLLADLSSMPQVVQLSQAFTRQFDTLDVLVNNAGIFLTRYQETSEGFETQWAVNYLAPYLLTRRLLPLINNSAPARIINVSSNGHFRGTMDLDNLQGKDQYDGLKAYTQSKLGNVLFTKELAVRLKGTRITSNALHPGVVRTGIGNRHNNSWISWVWNLGKPFMLSEKNGAKTSVYLATSEQVKDTSGEYFIKCRSQPSAALSYQEELAADLWNISEEMVRSYLA